MAMNSELRTDIRLALGCLKRQIDASHRRDAGVESLIVQGDERVQREQKLAFEIDLQTRRQ